MKCKDCIHYVKEDSMYGYCDIKREKNEVDKLSLRKPSTVACRKARTEKSEDIIDMGICKYCKYRTTDMVKEPCFGCSAQMGAFHFDLSEHDKQIRSEVIDEFVAKADGAILRDCLDAEEGEYRVSDVKNTLEKLADQLKESEDKNV